MNPVGRRGGGSWECCLALSLDLLYRLSSTKRKEPRAPEDQVLPDSETKVGVQVNGEETSGSLSPRCTFYPLPHLCRPSGRFLDSEYAGHLPVLK